LIVGYARVSTTDQNLDRQVDAFTKFGVEKIYSDKMSGKNFERVSYIKMLSNLSAGDILVIKSIDRLGRNYDMIIDEWRKITKDIGADIVVLDMPLLDTRDKEKGLTGKFISDIVLQILSYVAETERNNIKQRQAEGIKIAKEKGIHMGRPRLEIPTNFHTVAKDWQENNISLKDALNTLHMNKSTFYKLAKQLGYNKAHEKKSAQKKFYRLTSDFITKDYDNKKQIAKDLCVSSGTLNNYLKGQANIIDRMGIKIEIIQKGGQE
jgi:DNA invertase Pin-like site-specific DNA recombinase